MSRKCLVVGITLLFIGTAIIPSIGQPIEEVTLPISKGNTLYVGGSRPGNYSKIQDAINASYDGDTVFVFQGSYHEKVFINKSISVLGENASRTFINYTLEPNWYQHVVLICSHNVVFSGFTVVLEQGDSVGIRLNDSQNCTLSHNILKASWGMYLRNSYNTTIENNSFFTSVGGIAIADKNMNASYNIIKQNWFTNSGSPGHAWTFGVMLFDQARYNVISDNYFYYCTSHAIYSRSPFRNIIERNVIQQNISNGVGIGIYLYDMSTSPGNIIRENDITGCINGIATVGDYFTIENNSVHDNVDGMYISGYYYYLTVSNNTFLNDSFGLDMVYGMNGSTVEQNKFYGCWLALYLEYCHGLMIRYNDFMDNTWAVHPDHSSLNNISRNNFIRNRHYVLSFLSRNIWWGNYWNRPRFLPKLIVGFLPFIQFDWHPAQQPN
jgi:nitrous oxidase accessory protein NosD